MVGRGGEKTIMMTIQRFFYILVLHTFNPSPSSLEINWFQLNYDSKWLLKSIVKYANIIQTHSSLNINNEKKGEEEKKRLIYKQPFSVS